MISLCPATLADGATLANLMQLYSYDWSELNQLEVNDNGRFADYPLEAYWRDPWRHPFLLKVDEKLAGLALITERSRLTGSSEVFDMAEFFVMRRYRRQGVGLVAAAAAFALFRGNWELRQRPENTAATAFWRRAIQSYTQHPYQEVYWNDATWVGPVQRFSSMRAS